jgi:putative MATE family efflux protein
VIVIRKNNILEDPIGLLLLKLSAPAMAGMVIYSLLSIADTFFIARLGARAMAALTICIPVYSLVVSLASGTGVGITSAVSRRLGEGEIKHADNVAWHGLIISFIYGIIFIWVGIKYIDPLLILFGCTPEIFAMCRQYLIINLLACMFTFPSMIIANIIQGEGNTAIPMITLLLGMGLNVALDPVLMFGFGPIEAMGLNGAALAGVAAQVITTLFLIISLFKRREYLPWSLKNIRPDIKVMADIYTVAIPSTVMEILGVFVMVILNRIVADFSITALAALGIFLRIRSLFFVSVYGLSQGSLPITGFAYGARYYDRV